MITAPIKVMRLLCNQMILNGHDCQVYYIDETEEKLFFQCPTIKTNVCLRGLNIDDFDIIHSTGLRPDIYLSLKRRNKKTKFISTIHNFFIEDFTSSYGSLIAKIAGRIWMNRLNRLNKVVTLSNTGVEYYKHWIRSEKLTYAYNAIDANKDFPSNYDNIVDEILSFKGDSKLIGAHAMLSSVKGIDVILKALPLLPDYKFCVVGDGIERNNLEVLAMDLGISNRVKFLGYQATACVYLSLYEVFAIPSRSEGFPLVLLEAALNKKIVVCSDIPIFKEILSSNEAFFFELNSPKSFASAILRINEKTQSGQNLYKKYLSSYTPENFYKRYISIYEGKV